MSAPRIRKYDAIGSLLWLIAGVLVTAMAISVPVHFQSIAPSVLAAAGRGTLTAPALAGRLLRNGAIGPVDLMWEGTPGYTPPAQARERLEALLADEPRMRLAGGTAPFYQEFLALIEANPEAPDPSVVARLVSSANREELLGFLSESRRLSVQFVLDTRGLTTVTRFMPVSSAAGQPLEAALLLTALLLQADRVDLDLADAIAETAQAALEGSRIAVGELEDLYLAVLTLGRRLNWAQMTELTRRLAGADQLVAAGELFRLHPEQLPELYTALLLHPDPASLRDYLGSVGADEGWRAIGEALRHGQGALAILTERQQPLYRSPGRLAFVDAYLSPPESPLLDLTARAPFLAVVLKGLLFLHGGLFLVLASGCVARVVTGRRSRLPIWHPLTQGRRLLGAALIGGTLWIMAEPAVLAVSPSPERLLRLDFIDVNRLEALQSQNLAPSLMDRVTLYIILAFFALQLVVYLVGLTKLVEIRGTKGSASFKIELVANEENLFDLGLYVGLGGTVASLILLAMDIVSASLIAAYSSTLFGIIFVGLLKVLHVRPYRRVLLIQRERELRGSAGTRPDAAHVSDAGIPISEPRKGDPATEPTAVAASDEPDPAADSR